MNCQSPPVRLCVATAHRHAELMDFERIVVMECDDPKLTLRQLLNTAWQALRGFKGDEIARATRVLEPMLTRSATLVDAAYRDEIQTLVAVGRVWQDDVDAAMSLAREVLERPEASRFHFVLITLVRYGFWRTHQFPSFYESSRPRLDRPHALTALAHIVNLSVEAGIEAEHLRLKLAERLAKEAIDLSSQVSGLESYAALMSTCVLAHVAYEMGAIQDADALIRGKLPAIEQRGSPQSTLWGYTVGAKIAFARGNSSVALFLLRRGQEIGEERGWSQLALCCAADEIAILIAQGRLDPAKHVLARASELARRFDDVRSRHPADSWPLDVARYRVALATGATSHAFDGFTHLRNLARSYHHMAWVVRLTALLAGSLFKAGRDEDAYKEMFDALQLGADAGLFRTFVDEMAFIEPCLRQMCIALRSQLGHLNLYIGSLLARTERVIEGKAAISTKNAANVLSAKETVILRLISVGFSNKRIARELHIAPETVKSHAKRIFIKLSTKTRAEAVARGAELGII